MLNWLASCFSGQAQSYPRYRDEGEDECLTWYDESGRPSVKQLLLHNVCVVEGGMQAFVWNPGAEFKARDKHTHDTSKGHYSHVSSPIPNLQDMKSVETWALAILSLALNTKPQVCDTRIAMLKQTAVL